MKTEQDNCSGSIVVTGKVEAFPTWITAFSPFLRMQVGSHLRTIGKYLLRSMEIYTISVSKMKIFLVVWQAISLTRKKRANWQVNKIRENCKWMNWYYKSQFMMLRKIKNTGQILSLCAILEKTLQTKGRLNVYLSQSDFTIIN